MTNDEERLRRLLALDPADEGAARAEQRAQARRSSVPTYWRPVITRLVIEGRRDVVTVSWHWQRRSDEPQHSRTMSFDLGYAAWAQLGARQIRFFGSSRVESSRGSFRWQTELLQQIRAHGASCGCFARRHRDTRFCEGMSIAVHAAEIWFNVYSQRQSTIVGWYALSLRAARLINSQVAGAQAQLAIGQTAIVVDIGGDRG